MPVSAIGRHDKLPTAVVGSTQIVSATPTLDTNAYADNDHMGTLMTLTDALRQAQGDGQNNTGILESIVILDKAAQSAAMSIFIFNASPTITSSDNAALNISDAEMEKCLGIIAVEATDYISTSANSVATIKNIGLTLKANSTSLYALLKSEGSPTYAAGSLVLKFGILQD